MMSFPDTFEEFLEQYSFKDDRKVYTNGTTLIPVFRVNQMIDHYFSRDNLPSNCIMKETKSFT